LETAILGELLVDVSILIDSARERLDVIGVLAMVNAYHYGTPDGSWPQLRHF